ncbi:carboxymuconolactone decarboxylase family protein [Chitinophaga silvatica]|uniref:Carboxymuconolactone decarboxylase family protein n=1 Tax=Chitinophaga silvatica TaxID=2282649 RepID=A0A3E1YAK7_9BACT|nr:carboxymuconolactone decarboxylase family protein [Chitinophaga silvatica]RFS22712.1 carboxymuconolactone decarboxylase family protein [Chitinophaga silvatica]
MKQRLNFFAIGGPVLKALYTLGNVAGKAIDQKLLHLIYIRVSQLNGCGFCLDMHTKDLREMGETEQRMLLLGAWREAKVYTNREKAALAWAEALTNLAPDGVSDEVYNTATEHFTPEELVHLSSAVITINGYNRLNVAFRTPAGDYQPGQYA